LPLLSYLHSPRPLPPLHSFPTRRSSDLPPLIVAGLAVLVSAGFFAVYSTIGPSTSYTAAELVCLRKNAQEHPGASAEPFSTSDADRKSTRLNSSHEWISYAVFCLKKKTK